MLIVMRRVGQSLLIQPQVDLDPATPVGELFALGPIEIAFERVSGSRVKLMVVADRRLLVLRKELAKNG